MNKHALIINVVYERSAHLYSVTVDFCKYSFLMFATISVIAPRRTLAYLS